MSQDLHVEKETPAFSKRLGRERKFETFRELVSLKKWAVKQSIKAGALQKCA